ncbi:acetyl-CoA carboxylase, carboxyltransferase subunit beta [Sinanaerobacter sp. ZZT-01]|uniref:acetyl-CoA carboxylase, carboxyltransferase subunit beta n=1 Tax=Sinanaerobacter sp. ZZT-01 TaxID=3111540 RepID=UPI002D77C703|nr:acetyl-CoA carboxylase, carboxyltransferase subunit beta [Sinanaerobacter sp. ZZT-01]WRR92102.1 acetyl-CoA carboxylase, carboxyltransferase subunit beta [Sinanaerobacter sp. ZZT-01]
MLKKGLFRKPKNELEYKEVEQVISQPCIPDDVCISCPECKNTLFVSEVKENSHVCPVCGRHFKISARERLHMILDEDSFEELYSDLISFNRIDFPGYDDKLETAMQDSGESESVICAQGTIGGFNTAIFAMDSKFMMGSMGTVVGEKVTRLFEYATQKKLPVIGYTLSGGARMQEGILSLMQMAKTSGAVKRHSDAGNLYVVVLTDPTTGGVSASFAMEGDIILAEPKALVGFAGPRVIEQTIRQKLPQGFQRSEFLLEKGFVDAIVERKDQRDYLKNILALHSKEVLL